MSQRSLHLSKKRGGLSHFFRVLQGGNNSRYNPDLNQNLRNLPLPTGSEGECPLIILQSVRESPTQLLNVNVFKYGGPSLHGRQLGLSTGVLGVFFVDIGREILPNLKQLLFQSGQKVQIVSRYQKFELKGIFEPVWNVKGRKILQEK